MHGNMNVELSLSVQTNTYGCRGVARPRRKSGSLYILGCVHSLYRILLKSRSEFYVYRQEGGQSK